MSTIYKLCQKKLYNFQFQIAEKVNKARQQHSVGQKHNFPVCKKILNGIVPWSGVKVMVLCVKSGKNKVGHFIILKAMVRAPLVKHTLI